MGSKPKLDAIDIALTNCIQEAYRRTFTVKSDYARANAEFVAMAASMGLISTKLGGNVFSSDWRPTMRGLAFLEVKLGRTFDDDGTLDEGHNG